MLAQVFEVVQCVFRVIASAVAAISLLSLKHHWRSNPLCSSIRFVLMPYLLHFAKRYQLLNVCRSIHADIHLLFHPILPIYSSSRSVLQRNNEGLSYL